MPIWKADSVEEQPMMHPYRWVIYETPDGKRYINSATLYYYGVEGKVSTEIIEWNSETRIAKTRSGRKYLLDIRAEGHQNDALYVLNRWCHIFNLSPREDLKDVSEEYR